MANQITIGRNPQNTIVVDAQYNTVSGSHATICRNGNTLTFEDHSTNGSYINGQKVHHSSITIQQGDIITLGHQYTLNMNDVLCYMGGSRDTQRTPQVPGTAREIPTPIVRQEPQHIEEYYGTMPDSHMGLAIVSLLLGISIPLCWILSALAIVNASQVESRWRNKDYSGANYASAKAKRLGWWSIGIGFALVILWVIMVIIMMMSGEL